MALNDMFAKKMKPAPKKFADEGPPSGGDEPRAGGAGEADMGMEEMDEPEVPGAPESSPDVDGGEGGYHDHAELAADDLADIVGVSPEDRQDFGDALKAYVHACVADVLAGEKSDEENTPEV